MDTNLNVESLLNGVKLMKNATIKIQGDKTLYFDPIGIEGEPGDADFVFVSHSHYDHYSLDDIKKLAKSDMALIVPVDCVESAKSAGFGKIVAVKPSESYEVDGLKFSTVPAYNIGKKYHKKENKWVGYIVHVNSASYYFAGDTDYIPEMNEIRADVVFLPVGGTYTMNAHEAAEAANVINPAVAVPMHYGDVAGSPDDAAQFIKELKPSIKGIILK